ncbi:ATP-binding protein [Yoonia sediminilitoris]|uniref:histidine kinase n=1 Tax=Yoonia sediminilitoris TaxID=1286148 RepID=A0A2T6KMA8_9RHOB|nr:ATP-binding protein [Yoonia sediminilitoris]PUB17297.1 signal transduction histidine kinase [Yoonia sediminilitoris]RCW97592.1 signal transduction histidine kinase [Yoonia sediminilitoris]
MISLRARAITGGVIWAIFTIIIGVFGLASYVDRLAQERFDELLVTRHTQAVISVAKSAMTQNSIASGIGEASYRRPFSGQYWQVIAPDGEVFVSESLVDARLPRPGPNTGKISIANFVGETDEQLRRIEEWLTLEDGSIWHVQVASSLSSLLQDRNQLRGNLLLAFGLIAILGIIGAFLQASTTLRPLNDLRREVLSRWDKEGGLDVAGYPVEVAPLVNDINTLLDRNREIITRSRRQAADLAHAVKTPSAIVRNELEALQRNGQPVDQSIAALNRLDAQLNRSFARIRADGGSSSINTYTDLDISLGRMSKAFTSLAGNLGKVLISDISSNLRVRMDRTDFEEVIGNLLDNALKWSATEIRITARDEQDHVAIIIEDDGPGIPEADRKTAMMSGQRLDTSQPGTGLGLAIATDVAYAYGGEVTLGTSDRLGGLKVTIRLKTSGF